MYLTIDGVLQLLLSGQIPKASVSRFAEWEQVAWWIIQGHIRDTTAVGEGWRDGKACAFSSDAHEGSTVN